MTEFVAHNLCIFPAILNKHENGTVTGCWKDAI
jgi:hypothetical protein